MVERVRAWAPGVPLVREVFHATMTGHAYPAHTHDTWTVLLVDEGCVTYDLDRHPRTSPQRRVSLLPPHVAHDGRSARAGLGFRKPAARALRDLLDAHVADGLSLEEAGRLLGRSPAHLARTFTQTYGIAPHRYLVGRRVDAARRLLLRGTPVSEAAVEAGFWDQAHLTRHFRRTVGTTPARFASGAWA